MSKQPPGYPKYAPSGYPQQCQAGYPGMVPPMYPTGPYPQQQTYPQMNQPMQPTSSPYGVPPPPYTSTPQQMYPQAGGPPSYPVQQRSHMPMQSYPGGMMPVAQGSFDAGARFGVGAAPNIPPPPPGHPPNHAQMAAAQGRPVVMTQNPDSWISGGSDGGYTIW
ncbi:calcium-binding protein P-like [Actinia tenebrosa]|uniref:DAZ-associated protein 2 n=1 Tax=Actinia tenebrosa TaxID=6105 RepID=A0A6P8I780_ACTTE|nr:calcium-binding protein P-like [Actinia tenebrosa]